MVSKKGGNKAVGRTKGGRNTKIHALTDALGNPMEFMINPGNVNDSQVAVSLLSHLDISESNILADKAYGTNQIGEYTIPYKSNTVHPWFCDFHTYKSRHVIECFFQKLKWFRRIATRYDKSDSVFLAFLYLASILILIPTE